MLSARNNERSVQRNGSGTVSLSTRKPAFFLSPSLTSSLVFPPIVHLRQKKFPPRKNNANDNLYDPSLRAVILKCYTLPYFSNVPKKSNYLLNQGKLLHLVCSVHSDSCFIDVDLRTN